MIDIDYSTFLPSLNLKECAVSNDTLKKECEGVYTMISNDPTETQKKALIRAVINDKYTVPIDEYGEPDNDLIKETLEDIFAKKKRNIH